MKTLSFALSLLLASSAADWAHQSFYTPAEVIHNSPEWKGERFADGRPKVPDSILDRMKNVTLEEAWSILRGAGFDNQYEDGWATDLFAGKIMVGRALTSSWIPGRLDLQKVIEADGIAEKRKGAPNAWPVDMLQPRDVYVSDHFGLKKDGPSIGDNVANAIYARSGNGIVYDGAVRDINGIRELPNFVTVARSYDPSHHFGRIEEVRPLNSTMISINAPTRIGKAAVMPGDVVLVRDGGVIFIPPQLAERVARQSERIRLRDIFGHLRLKEGTYTAGQIDRPWTPEIEADFAGYLRQNIDKLPVARPQIQEYLDDMAKGAKR